MRRILLLVLVALIAFLAGAADANGTLARLLADVHVGGTSSVPPTGAGSATPTAPAGIALSPSATATGRASAPSSTATAAPAATPSPTSMPPPPAPVSLGQIRPDGATLRAGAWTGAGGLTLQVMAPASAAGLRAEVEVRPAGQPFSGRPTGAAPVIQGIATVAVRGLAAGHYHWQARLTSAGGHGSWSPFAHGAAAFGIQVAEPPAPSISSATDPHPGTTYASATASFAWSAPADPSGIVGYGYRLDTDPHGGAHPVIRTLAQQVSLGGLGSGTYYFHVRAVDGVGNWGPSATFPVRIDVTPPQVTRVSFSGYYFNPVLESLRLHYTLSKVSRVTVGIYNAAGVRIRHIVPATLMPAGIPLTVRWDGRDNAGKIVPAGTYSVYLRATDRLGNSYVVGWSGLTVDDKRIVVSLSQQRLWAYGGKHLVLTTLVTTGNRVLPTPTGLFHVIFRRSPFTFISPWPKGSTYYYKPSPVHYVLYFHDYGYYIHDAPWRSVFGPGTNAAVGTPGQDYTGTHGCVNVPEGVMAQLYTWATPGTAVLIQQ